MAATAKKYNIGDRVTAGIRQVGSKKEVIFASCKAEDKLEERNFLIIGKDTTQYIILIEDDDLDGWTVNNYDGVDSKWKSSRGWFIDDKYLKPAGPKQRCLTCNR